MQPVLALPDGFDAGCAVPLPGYEPAELGKTPPQLAAWGRGRRRGAVRRHPRQGGPLLGGPDDRPGRCGIGPARPGDGVETPSHVQGQRQGIPSARRRLHAHLRTLPPVLEHPAQACSCPPTALPLHHQARARHSRSRETRQPAPRNRGRALGRAGLLGSDRADRHGRQLASQPTGPRAGHGCGRAREGARAGRARRLARAVDGERPPGGRLLPLGPSIPRDGSWREAPRTRGAQDTCCPVVGRPAPRVHPPLLASAVARGHRDHQGGRTGLCDLAGAWRARPPALTLCLCHGCALARLGHRRLWPRPDVPPHHPAVDPRGRTRPRGMAPRRRTGFARDGAPPGLRLRRTIMQNRRVWHPHHDLRCADALQGGAGMARQPRWDPTIRMSQKALGGHRLGPALPCRWQTTERPCAPPVSPRGEALRMPGSVPLALRAVCLDPVAQRHAPLHDYCRALSQLERRSGLCPQDVYNAERPA